MIFVDNLNKSGVEESFAYTSTHDVVEYVYADTNASLVELKDEDGAPLSKIFYEDIPKLILALQAAYDFKFKGEA